MAHSIRDMSYLYTALGFMALIVAHEAGHFLAAKATGMRVERFSLFFGNPLISVRRGETEYGIGWLPAGGYVKISGMNPNEELEREQELAALRRELSGSSSNHAGRASGAQRAELQARCDALAEEVAQVKARGYYNQAVWKRVVVILAGPFVNLLIAFIVLFVIYSTNQVAVYNHRGQPVISDTVAAVLPGSPAAGKLMAGDRIIAVDGRRDLDAAQIQRQIDSHRCAGPLVDGCRARTPVSIEVRRHGRLLTLTLRPQYFSAYGRMLVGFDFAQRYRSLGVLGAASSTVDKLGSVTGETISAIARIFQPKERSKLHGVVGIVAVTSQEFSFSTVDALYTLALISLSLAIVNLFPFLPLDGGHVFWALAEKVRGRRVSFATMERAGVVGFALIILIFAIGLSNDISTLTGHGFNVR
jgi:regulator of sigma E protease